MCSNTHTQQESEYFINPYRNYVKILSKEKIAGATETTCSCRLSHANVFYDARMIKENPTFLKKEFLAVV